MEEHEQTLKEIKKLEEEELPYWLDQRKKLEARIAAARAASGQTGPIQ